MNKFIYKTPHIRGVDALRALAALAVVFHHSYIPQVGVPLYDSFLTFFYRHGTLGVDLFFLLSGFCIHGAYSAARDRFSSKNYLIRRWWRIYPPYFFALGLAVILNLFTNYLKWYAGESLTPDNFGALPVFTHLFLVHDLSQKTMLTISGPFWTIAMEAQFYLFYLVLRPFFYDSKGWAILFVSALVAYAVAWHFYYLPWPVQPLNPFCYWIQWVLGAFLAYVVRTKMWQTFPKKWLILPFILFAGLSVAPYFATHDTLSRLMISSAFTFLILFFLDLENLWASAWFGWLPQLGIFSYSTYLVHFLFLDRIRVFVLPHVPEGVLRCLASMAAIGLCVSISYLFFLCCEKPFLKKAASVPKY